MEVSMSLIFKCILISVFNINIIATSSTFDELENFQNRTDFKSNFAYEVVKNVYQNVQPWYFTVIFCKFTYFENRILKYTETLSEKPVMLLDGCPVSKKVKVKPTFTRHGETAYIVTSSELSLQVNDEVISTLKRTGVWKPRTLVIFIITIPVKIDSYFNFDMKTHFSLLWSKRITKSILIVWSDRMRIYMFNRYLDRVMEVTETRNITKVLDEQFYNMYGHDLRLSFFRKIYIDDTKSPPKCDSRLAKTFIEYVNASCTVVPTRDGQTVGDLMENGTATGVTADLLDGYTDLDLNSRILKNSYYGYIDTTYPLSQDNLCFIVRKSPRQSSFITAMKLITTTVFVIFLVNMTVLIGVALIVRKKECWVRNFEDHYNTGAIVFDLLKCFLKQTVEVKFPGPVFRVVVLSIILYSLVVNCAIDGILTTAITYPRFKGELNHISHLASSNLTVGIHNRHLGIFLQSLNVASRSIIFPKIEKMNDEKIKGIFARKIMNYAILLRRTDGKRVCTKISNMDNGIPLYHIMQECPVPCFVVYGLRYGSPHLPRLEKLLYRLNEAGILNVWSSSETNDQVQTRRLIVENNRENKPLTMNNMREVFYVWLTGLGLSAIVFLIEFFKYFIKHLFII